MPFSTATTNRSRNMAFMLLFVVAVETFGSESAITSLNATAVSSSVLPRDDERREGERADGEHHAHHVVHIVAALANQRHGDHVASSVLGVLRALGARLVPRPLRELDPILEVQPIRVLPQRASGIGAPRQPNDDVHLLHVPREGLQLHLLKEGTTVALLPPHRTGSHFGPVVGRQVARLGAVHHLELLGVAKFVLRPTSRGERRLELLHHRPGEPAVLQLGRRAVAVRKEAARLQARHVRVAREARIEPAADNLDVAAEGLRYRIDLGDGVDGAADLDEIPCAARVYDAARASARERRDILLD
eukprot:4808274-Prymnesium_polylepis.1